jgi:hypothetical protein
MGSQAIEFGRKREGTRRQSQQLCSTFPERKKSCMSAMALSQKTLGRAKPRLRDPARPKHNFRPRESQC